MLARAVSEAALVRSPIMSVADGLARTSLSSVPVAPEVVPPMSSKAAATSRELTRLAHWRRASDSAEWASSTIQ